MTAVRDNQSTSRVGETIITGVRASTDSLPHRRPEFALPSGHLMFLLIVLAFAAYAGAFIVKTSFVVGGTRYFCLADDAMISMCYARNLAAGDGLVWYPGAEKVEGFTNPLWVLYMAVLHLMPVAPAKMSLLVQITGAACLVANLFFVRKIARMISPQSSLVWIGATVLTAFYLPLNNWSMQGMEVGLLTLMVSIAVWLSIDSLDKHRFPWSLPVLMGASLLVRIDMLIPCLVIAAYLVVADSQYRLGHLTMAVFALAIGLCAQTAFRLWYYGDILPNTYYLKMTGYPALLRIARGTLVLFDFVGHLNWILFLLPLSLLILRPAGQFFNSVNECRVRFVVLPHHLLMLVFGGQVAYSVYTGGDAWEWWGGSNRFISIAMPLYFVLLCCAFDTILARLQESAGYNGASIRAWRFWKPAAMCLGIGGALLNANALTGPASWSFLRLEHPPLHVDHNRQMVERALLIEKVTSADATIALQWAGIIPYFCNRKPIDLLGKNDRYVARLPMHRGPGLRWFYPGHLKWDLDYSLGKLRPDIMEQPWTRSDPSDEKCLDEFVEVELDGARLLVRKDSRRVRSDALLKVAELPDQSGFANRPTQASRFVKETR
jgi:hypothetical protein